MFGYRMCWKKFIWRIAWASVINSSNAKKTIRSWSIWSRAMKIGLFTTSAEKEVGVGEVKYQERQAKAEIHQKKVMLSMWWDWKRLVFYELLPKNKMINSDVYCEQLQKLSDAIAQKRPELINRKGVMFHHDNARPHTNLTRQKLLQHEMCYHIHRIAQILHHQISISFAPRKTPWMVKHLLLKISSNST